MPGPLGRRHRRGHRGADRELHRLLHSAVDVTNAGEITNVGSGLCLGPASGNTANGTALQLQTCTNANTQQWNEQ